MGQRDKKNHAGQNTVDPFFKLLEDLKVKILLFLSEQRETMAVESIASHLRISPQIALHHLTELKKDAMVLISRIINAPPLWSLGNEGRKYLIDNNLIS